MKLNSGKMTLLVGAEGTTIEIIDDNASLTFCSIQLTNDQLAMLLSRCAHVKCDIEVRGLDLVGKMMIHKPHIFDITDLKYDYSERHQALSEKIKETLPEGWVSDNNFARQNTFIQKDGRKYAQTTIRSWVDIND